MIILATRLLSTCFSCFMSNCHNPCQAHNSPVFTHSTVNLRSWLAELRSPSGFSNLSLTVVLCVKTGLMVQDVCQLINLRVDYNLTKTGKVWQSWQGGDSGRDSAKETSHFGDRKSTEPNSLTRYNYGGINFFSSLQSETSNKSHNLFFRHPQPPPTKNDRIQNRKPQNQVWGRKLLAPKIVFGSA